ncbi:sensor domain-containing diguanylate cyclase [Sphingorhabdus sp. SMR4y]|uniref:GGDEF domain-containing protein n=1 Tax=Sphingorhabdus sp. SMR4y TaxID=2584094 RepID=UPI000B5C9856|nr:diguanylate cyclase [Sphingorhabdus sp. SMR4y]ASK87244.1 putative signaling protein [Sphingorhabdus sp. SMR4y]
MQSLIRQFIHRLIPPVPETVRDEFAILSATRLQSQSRALFLAMFLTIPFVLYASSVGAEPWIRYGMPLAMGSCCLIGFLSLIKDRNASGSPDLARKFIAEATFFSAAICGLVSIWCVLSYVHAPEDMKLFYPFTLAMGSLTTIYTLATIRLAAILNIIIGIMPITIILLLSRDPLAWSAAASLIMVTTFLYRLITQQNDQFIHMLLLQNDMSKLAHTDPLTGLFNRRVLAENLARQINEQDVERTFSVALVDLDGFKPVNDQFGHAVGDQLLVEVAKRLRKACGDNGIVARMGGDEFAVLLSPDSAISDTACADHLLAALVPPCVVQDHVIRVRASVGIATWPLDGTTANSLLESADRQLYAVKNYTAKAKVFASKNAEKVRTTSG